MGQEVYGTADAHGKAVSRTVAQPAEPEVAPRSLLLQRRVDRRAATDGPQKLVGQSCGGSARPQRQLHQEPLECHLEFQRAELSLNSARVPAKVYACNQAERTPNQIHSG